MKLTFLGANHDVTGSQTLLEWLPGHYLLVDYGMKQGINEYESAPLPVQPSQIQYVLLTHAHIDHSGNLPLLYKNGFRGKIYATAETVSLCSIMLADSAHIQENEATSQNKKNIRSGIPTVQPLYTIEDVDQTMKLFRPCVYDQLIDIDEGLTVRFTDIGHLLGSAAIECFLEKNGQKRKIVFSGDIGNKNQPIINDPHTIESTDYLLIESTYGNRLHDHAVDPIPALVGILQETFDRGGSVIIPSFAVGRTQELLYFFREIKNRHLMGAYEQFPVYVDSPMANEATAVFLQCDISCLDQETRNVMKNGDNPIWFEGLQAITETAESKALNDNDEPKVIIASGGMCEGGRIRHHLKHNLWDKKNTILFTGYQANGTLGRIIYDGAKNVKIYGEIIEVNAQIRLLSGVSGHADQEGLLQWVSCFANKPGHIFINHGDDDASLFLMNKIRDEFAIPVDVPFSGSSFDLLKGEWICLKEPVKVKKTQDKAFSDNKKKKEKNEYYENLLDAVAELEKHVKNMKGYSNSELREMARKIREIL